MQLIEDFDDSPVFWPFVITIAFDGDMGNTIVFVPCVLEDLLTSGNR